MRMPQPPSGPGTAAQNGAADATSSTGATEVAGSVDQGTNLAAMNGQAEHHAEQVRQPAGKRFTAMLTLAEATVRRHWLASALIAAGLVMRILVQAAYQPAIIYIDTLKYLYSAWPGSDPVAYKIPLKMILALGGNLNTVEAIQHLLGLAIAITLYVVLVRRGTPRWLAALSMAPVLFDAYQLQAEAMIMPDVWFEAMIVAGLAVLLWQKRPTLLTLIIGAALLGGSTGVRQAGEIMIVPALVLVVVLGGGLRKVLTGVVAVTFAFLGAIVLYMGAALALTGQARISYSGSSLTYGRMAAVADCATLNIPKPARLLCPTKWEKAQGPDWLQHSSQGPNRMFGTRLAVVYPNLAGDKAIFVSAFNHAVERQQPLRVITAILRDSIKVFALTRDTSPGDTPIWRWQFHGYYPTYGQYVSVNPVTNTLYIKLPHQHPRPLSAAFGPKHPQVDVPIARFLRSYQIHGGYTPGPLILLSVLAALAGSLLLAFRRRMTPAARELSVACITVFAAALAVLAISDAFEFSWRYQLPAIVTLPAAGAAGIAAILVVARRRGAHATPAAVSERAPEPAQAP